MEASPFKAPTYEWDNPFPKVQKCVLCFDRIEKGGRTACAWVCPTAATRFGNRDDLIQIAQYLLDTNPEKYVDHIFGLEEVGGTSVIMLSNVPFEDLGFPVNTGTKALPELTGRVLNMIPGIAIAGGILLGGIWWVINRRIDLEEQNKPKGDNKNDNQDKNPDA
jgi:formate dehydrogenase iron-sulfur subunit